MGPSKEETLLAIELEHGTLLDGGGDDGSFAGCAEASSAIAVDARCRIINVSAAAQRLLCAPASCLLGQPLQSAVADAGLRKLIENSLIGARPTSALLRLGGGTRRCLSVRAEPLLDGQGRAAGALVTITDACAFPAALTCRGAI
jgi:PAS domain-containing protein